MSIAKYKGIYLDFAVLIISFLLLFHLIYLHKGYYIPYWTAILGIFFWGFWVFQKGEVKKSVFRRLIVTGIIVIITNLFYIFSLCRQQIPFRNVYYFQCNSTYLILPTLLCMYGIFMIIRGIKTWKRYSKPSQPGSNVVH
jgi:hypothetical protein